MGMIDTWFKRLGVWPLALLLIVIGLVSLYSSYRYVKHYELTIQHDMAVQNAALYAHALNEFRSLYSSEVVQRLAGSEAVVSHDYLKHPYGVPLPATMSIMLGERIGKQLGEAQMNLSSPYPFPWRAQSESSHKEFETKAWQQLNLTPDIAFYEFVSDSHGHYIRYAVADVMRASCVNCHNTHPQSPKNDWKIGDVRGVMTLIFPITASPEVTYKLQQNSRLVFSAGLLLFVILTMALLLLRRYSLQLSVQVEQRTSELQTEMAERELAQRNQLLNAERLNQMIEAALNAVVVIDADSVVRNWNPQMEIISDITADEAIGQHIYDLIIPKDKRQQHRQAIKQFLMEGHSDVLDRLMEMEIQRKDGELVPVEMSIHSFKQENLQLFSAFIRDITERKQFEQMLIASKIAAEEANFAKSRFISNMSHEIRTPLNAVIGYSQLMRNDDTLGEKQKGFINTIERSGDHLLELINEILDLSKIEAGAMVLNNIVFDVNELIEDLTAMFTYRCEQASLEWSCQINWEGIKIVNGDQGKLRQVLINLLGNAIKFTESGKITLEVSQQEADRFRFAVSDTGMGIEKQEQHKLFKPFSQVSMEEEKGGTGLGLSISKSYVEMMGGKLQLRSEVNEGSEFYFTIGLSEAKPASQAVELSKYRRVTQLQPGYGVVAFVVDDVSENRELLGTVLQRIGVKVSIASHGEEVLHMLHQEQPDIIFLDLRMPGLSGEETYDRIQQEFPNNSIKVVAVSAFSLAHEVEHYLEKGFEQYITKPFKMEEIYQSLESHLGVKFQYAETQTLPDEAQQLETLDTGNIDIAPVTLQALHDAAQLNELTQIEEILEQLESQEGDNTAFIQFTNQCLQQLDTEPLLLVVTQLMQQQQRNHNPGEH